MQTIQTIADYRAWRNCLEPNTKVGFVPTMGALHDGHAELIRRSVLECDVTVVSIFVNPTQFNDPKDCETYPQPLEEDLMLCRSLGTSVVWTPTKRQLYPDDYRFRVIENQESLRMEGTFRPGHFDGVLTVVMKLLQVVKANEAYFGEKDWQQLQLVTDMTKAFFLETNIVPCPTIREKDGLAMSSRNRRLSDAARAKAPRFHQILKQSESCIVAKNKLQEEGFEVEYVEETSTRRLGAVVLDGVRLIDNLAIKDIGREIS